ncbi:prenyltransferase/squalene oxidase repeat-containing protein [Plantactinospora sonchi]|uniref:Prenyltransferase/squalene oxidase repeat-containing protein n=1 Tax=Plantactinospora sonchi TaxID=1544735 RepID=A0ABU7RZ54_9ACTN
MSPAPAPTVPLTPVPTRRRPRSVRRRLRASLAGLVAVLAAATAALVGFTVAVAAEPVNLVGSAGPVGDCTPTRGAVVAVDFGPWDGPVVRGCALSPTNGLELLHQAGFRTTGTVHDGPGFVCRIGNPEFDDATEYPTPAQEACPQTPPASAYWSYWLAPAGQEHWTYSPLGALSHVPAPGEVEAWVFGGTEIGGAGGQPSFSPASVRATGPGGGDPTDAPTGTPTPSGQPSDPPAGDAVARGAAYLVGQLTDGDHVFNEVGGFPDHTRTFQVGIALAAAGSQDAALRRVVDHLAAHVDTYAYPDGTGSPPNSAAVAQLSLLAEIVGRDATGFGGRDLPGTLLDNVCAEAGSLGNCTAPGDFHGIAAPVPQAIGVLALARAGVEVPVSAVDRLRQLQCADGGFAGSLILPGDWCESEVGTTGFVAQALSLVPDAAPAVAKAKDYLLAQRMTDGGFPPYLGAPGGDTGSTGSAVQALTALGAPAAAAPGRSWLAARQQEGGGFVPDEFTPDVDLYASVLAVPALAGVDLATLVHDPTAPSPSPSTPGPGPSGSPGGTPTGNPPADPGPDLTRGVAYLVDPVRLVDGHYHETLAGSGFADFGLTIDTGYALAATGDDGALARMLRFLDGSGRDGSGRGVLGWTGVGTPYASGGSIGKLALLAEATGHDPRKFAGTDLIDALGTAICAEASTGTDRSCAGPGNYTYATSVFSQSLGIMAQVRAGDVERVAGPVAYLRGLQAPDGSWPSLIPDTGDADVDSTAIAAMALDLLPGDEDAAAVGKALDWIAAQQRPDGGFPGAAGNSTNSAALAIQGLSLDRSRYGAQVSRARAFLAARQNPDGGFDVASDGPDGSDLRASVQALGGAVGTSFGTLYRDVTTVTPDPDPAPGGSGPPGDHPSGSGGGLALTGADIGRLGWLAAALIGLGGGLVLATSRRRRLVTATDSSSTSSPDAATAPATAADRTERN